MTKTKITILTAILLVAVMLLSSCSIGGSLKLKDTLDGSLYKEPAVATTATLIPELQGADVMYAGDTLIYFAIDTTEGKISFDLTPIYRHFVYNLEKGEIVFEEVDTDTVAYSISIGNSYALDERISSFFKVSKTTYKDEEVGPDYEISSISTAIYNIDGSLIASAERDCSVTSNYDLLHFDGKCYRLGDDGRYSYAFDYSALASLPYIIHSTDKFYFGVPSGALTGSSLKLCSYDKQLNITSTYSLPSYIEAEAGALLENGKLLVQGTVELDALTEKYDIYEDGTKYDLLTIIVDLEKGESKEIDFEYVIDNITPITDSEREYAGIKDSVVNLVTIYPIEDKRVNENKCRIATIDNNGKVKLIEEINGMNIEDIELVATNRWWISTDAGVEYLINEKAEIIGEVTKATWLANYLDCNGRLYDLDLDVILDYTEEQLSVIEEFDNSILFRNRDDEVILFANGQKTTLAAKDSKREYSTMFDCYGYFAIIDSSDESNVKTELYNSAGNNILTLSENGSVLYVTIISENVDGADLLCVAYSDKESYEVTYYEYYVIK